MEDYTTEQLELLNQELRELNDQQSQTISKYADRFANIRYERDMWHRRAVRLGWHQDDQGKWQPPPEDDEERTFWRDRSVRLQGEADLWQEQRKEMADEIDGLIEAAEHWRRKAGFDEGTDLVPEEDEDTELLPEPPGGGAAGMVNQRRREGWSRPRRWRG